MTDDETTTATLYPGPEILDKFDVDAGKNWVSLADLVERVERIEKLLAPFGDERPRTSIVAPLTEEQHAHILRQWELLLGPGDGRAP